MGGIQQTQFAAMRADDLTGQSKADAGAFPLCCEVWREYPFTQTRGHAGA